MNGKNRPIMDSFVRRLVEGL